MPADQAWATLQAAGLAFVLAKAGLSRRHKASAALPLILAAGAGGLACLLCREFPETAPAATGAIARAGGYAFALVVFARSLRPGDQPLVTRIALRIDPRATPRRLAYTRAVTWLWAGFFAINLLAIPFTLAIAPRHNPPWFAAWAALPLAAALFTAEFAFRCLWFRGQPHGSAAAMWRHAALWPRRKS